MRLSFVISTLTCGGAERVMTLLANEEIRRGRAVQLVTLDREPPFFALDPRVQLVQLDCERPSPTPLHAYLRLRKTIALLRRTIQAFGAEGVVSFTTRVNVKVLQATRRLNLPVIVSERSSPEGLPEGRRWTRLRDRWYPQAHRVVVQTEAVQKYFLRQGLTNLTVIPNPVEPPREPGVRPLRPVGTLFLAIARLEWYKGQDLLIRALAKTKNPLRVRFLGDGPDRSSLEALAQDLGVADRVEFRGFVTDKEPHWAEADGFVLSSRTEGFPNALCEALAAGVPSVSFDCPTGPAAIVENEVNGLLVPAEDVEGLAQALDRLASDRELRQRLSAAGPKILDRLGLSKVTDQWEAALR